MLVCPLLRKENFYTFIHWKKILFVKTEGRKEMLERKIKKRKNPSNLKNSSDPVEL